MSRAPLLLTGWRCHEQAADCAEYSENQPTRKLLQAAGKKEGDANIFPSELARSFLDVLASFYAFAMQTLACLQTKMLGRK